VQLKAEISFNCVIYVVTKYNFETQNIALKFIFIPDPEPRLDTGQYVHFVMCGRKEILVPIVQ